MAQVKKDFRSSNGASKGSKAQSKPFGKSRGAKGNSPKKRNFTKTDRPIQSGIDSNAMLRGISHEVAQGPTDLFPTSSASMQAFGNYVNAPGQDNFIESWNVVFLQANDPSAQPSYGFNPICKRACNAMRIDICSYFGATASTLVTGTMEDPLQMAALKLKQFIDTSFGTKTDYDPQDLLLYMMAVASIYPLIAEIKRDIRLVNSAIEGQYPQFVPRGLFALLEIADYNHRFTAGEGWIYSSKYLRGYIDQLNADILAFNALPQPPEIGMFAYNDDLFDAIYMDTEDLKTAQLYVFRNSEYWEYDEMATPYPMLVHRVFDYGSGLTIDEKLATLHSLIMKLTPLMTSATAMLQNLYNAYGSKDTLQIPTLDPASIPPLEFRYDTNILTMIDNMAILPATDVAISNMAANAVSNLIEGHVYLIPDEGNLNYGFNMPLEFHKPWETISQVDIGWAMRMHPTLRVYKDFQVYGGTGTSTDVTALCADGYTGFVIPRDAVIAYISDDGSIDTHSHIQRASNGWSPVAQDFKASPIAIWTDTSQATATHRQGGYYRASRDVEVTYRLEDIRLFWTYLTLNVWAADVNRNVIGTRTRNYHT